LSKTASGNGGGVRRQPTRWTRKRLLIGFGVLFLAGLIAAVLNLRFAFGGLPRREQPDSLLVLDARTMRTLRNVRGEAAPRSPALVRAGGLVWTLDARHNRVRGTNPLSGRVLRDEVVGSDPVDLAAGYGAVWVANRNNTSITRIDLGGGRTATLGLQEPPTAIATGAGALWVVSKLAEKVVRIDPASGHATKTVRLANPPLDVVARNGRVYLTIGD
jgi:hypothetical protein